MRIVKLAFLLFMLLFCNLTMVAYDAVVNGIYYNLDKNSKTAEVTSGDGNYSGEIVIPATIDYSNSTYRVITIGRSAFSYSRNLISISIPNSVTSIKNSAFRGCTSLKNVILSSSIKIIESDTFYDCSNLTSIIVPNSVESIEDMAFRGCIKLYSVSLPNSLTTIGRGSFCDCGLYSLIIPSSVISIEDGAFLSCEGLYYISVEKGNTVYDSRNDCNAIIETSTNKLLFGSNNTIIPSSVREIGSQAFNDLYRLSSITIPNSVTTIGWRAFENTGISSIILPNSVQIIEGRAFYGCKSLKSVSIPNSVKTMENAVFYNCGTLDNISTDMIEPLNIDKNVFPENAYSNGILYVPYSRKSLYISTFPWNNFNNIVEQSPHVFSLSITSSGSGYVTYSGNTIKNTTKTYTVNEGSSATLTFTPNSGYRIGNVKVNGINYTSYISNNQFTFNNINKDYTVEVTFEAIPTTYTLSITSSGNGYVTYSGTNINGTTRSFTVNEGSSATLTFSPNSGYKVGSVKVNNVDVTSSVFNNRYTISSINKNTTVSVTFEAIPPTTYTVSIFSSGNGYVTYSGTTINGTTKTFTVNSGTSATLTFTPNSGYRVGSLIINNAEYISSISDNKYTISNITKNTTVNVTFEAIPPATYGLMISSTGNGYVTYSGNTINETMKSYTVSEGASATLTFTPNNGYRVGSLKVNGTDVTSSISNNKYTISNINRNTTVSVTFEAIPSTNYTLSITSSGKGYVSFSGTSIDNTTKTFTVSEGSSITLVFTHAVDSRLAMLKVNNVDVTSDVSNNEYTINNISRNTTVSVVFEQSPSLTIISSEGGSVSHHFWQITNGTDTYTVEYGEEVSLTISPNSGYRIKSVIVNGNDVTSSISNNKYTFNIYVDTTVSVTFEAIPVTTYSLSITSSSSGYVTFAGTTINGTTKSFTINSGASATLTFTPNSGYRVGSLKVNNVDVTSSISNNKYTISNITKNTTVNVTFEAIPVTTYSLSITSSGNGYVTYSGTTINGTTKSFTVNSGASATLTFTPNSGYRVGSLKVNNVDVTSSISNNQYTISNINKNTTVSVTFEVIPILKLTYNGVNYSILSHTDYTVNVANGSYGQSLEVPASFVVDGVTWKVKGIDNDVITSNPQLAAIIWNPSVIFNISINNPNFLLYVTSANYATQAITNVIVNGTANKIVLTESASGNDFYCPKSFTAQSIYYTHYYSMTTGINESRGWETIALPFDVQLISHTKKGEILPFAKWRNGDSRCPFWLYQLTSNGWSEADGIKAYTPYVISMPNNDQYYDEARLNGNVTFSATSVRVEPTTVSTATYQGKTFTPCFTTKAANAGVFALNVKNQWASETNGQKEGSTFVQNLRTIHPFEAYMTTTNTTRSSFEIFEDMTTGIRGITELMDLRQATGVYNLKGQKIKVEDDKKMSAGIYIINGQKVIVK